MKMSKGVHNKQKAALIVVGLAVFIDMLIYGLVVPILPRYADSLGATQTEIGFLFSSYAIALFIATPIFGLLTDRIGRKTPLLWVNWTHSFHFNVRHSPHLLAACTGTCSSRGRSRNDLDSRARSAG